MIALSTQIEGMYHGDIDLTDWQGAGLPRPTKIKGVIQTIDRNVVERRLGTLVDADMVLLSQSLHAILPVVEQINVPPASQASS